MRRTTPNRTATTLRGEKEQRRSNAEAQVEWLRRIATLVIESFRSERSPKN